MIDISDFLTNITYPDSFVDGLKDVWHLHWLLMCHGDFQKHGTSQNLDISTWDIVIAKFRDSYFPNDHVEK